jgi:hypothetical protein
VRGFGKASVTKLKGELVAGAVKTENKGKGGN